MALTTTTLTHPQQILLQIKLHEVIAMRDTMEREARILEEIARAIGTPPFPDSTQMLRKLYDCLSDAIDPLIAELYPLAWPGEAPPTAPAAASVEIAPSVIASGAEPFAIELYRRELRRIYYSLQVCGERIYHMVLSFPLARAHSRAYSLECILRTALLDLSDPFAEYDAEFFPKY